MDERDEGTRLWVCLWEGAPFFVVLFLPFGPWAPSGYFGVREGAKGGYAVVTREIINNKKKTLTLFVLMGVGRTEKYATQI